MKRRVFGAYAVEAMREGYGPVSKYENESSDAKVITRIDRELYIIVEETPWNVYIDLDENFKTYDEEMQISLYNKNKITKVFQNKFELREHMTELLNEQNKTVPSQAQLAQEIMDELETKGYISHDSLHNVYVLKPCIEFIENLKKSHATS